MFAQQCFGLPDEGIEDVIDDSQAIRGFVGIGRNRESAPTRRLTISETRVAP
jgi:hypothetical protein